MADFEKQLNDTAKQLAELKEEFAGQRPVGEIVKYLLYFWLSVSVLLGIFGWQQLSDFDQKISSAVAGHFPRQSDRYRQYEELMENADGLRVKFEELTSLYMERIDDLKAYGDFAASDFDIEGRVQTIIEEANAARLSDSEWRTRAIMTLREFQALLEDRNFPGDFLFNVAQLCRRLRQFDLADEMTRAAYERDASPAMRARMLSSEIADLGAGPERERAYAELLQMVEELNYETSPHIVVSEAWNATEDTRTYQALSDALGRLITTRDADGVPSYAYLIRAQALLRRGNSEARGQAVEVLDQAVSVFEQESMYSQWADAFRREYLQLQLVLQDRPLPDGDTIEEMREAVIAAIEAGLLSSEASSDSAAGPASR